MKDEILPAQLRAARGLLNWSREELAKRSGTTERTIARIELEEGVIRKGTIAAVRTALEDVGIVFINEDNHSLGVVLKGAPIDHNN